MSKFTYFKLDSQEPLELNPTNEFIFNFIANLESNNNIVYLVSIDTENEHPYDCEIFITQNIEVALNGLQMLVHNQNQYIIVSVQEYPSYEGAYEVSLLMREPNELCYDK